MNRTESMLAAEFTIRDDFPPGDYDAWRALAEAGLTAETSHGPTFNDQLLRQTLDGIDVQPVYTARDFPTPDAVGFPGLPPFVRGSCPLGATQTGWDLRQEHAHPDLAISNRAIRDDLAGGVTSLLLRLDDAACRGLDPTELPARDLAGRGGVMVYRLDDLDSLLSGAALNEVGVTLEAGAAFLPAAAMLVALWRRRESSTAQAGACSTEPSASATRPSATSQRTIGAFNADPLAAYVREGQLPVAASELLAMLADLAHWTARHLPLVTSVQVSTTPYHDAGATAVQELGFALATAVEYLRSMTAAGMTIDDAAHQVVFRLTVGTDHFLSIARLRAARLVWSRVVEACGGSADAAALRIHAQLGTRLLTQRDPHVNLLRNTVGVFAAGLGGADAITSVPFDAAIGLPDAFSRRLARNTALVLQREAHLHRVIDPAGGSWYLERLTDQVAHKAWEVFQQVERHGGMLRAIESGWVGEQIDAAYARQVHQVAHRDRGITGVSEFPNLTEAPIVRPAPDRDALCRAAIARLTSERQTGDPPSDHQPSDHQPASVPLTPGNASSSRFTERMIAAAANGSTIRGMARALGFHIEPITTTRLPRRMLAAPFESLRDASDKWMVERGSRPGVFLANIGPVVEHIHRASFARNFFAAGGFEVVTNDGFADAHTASEAFSRDGARIAVICSSDQRAADVIPQVAARLKAAGARTVVLAANPGDHGDAWRQAGVDRFIFDGCDVLTTLGDLLREEGVLRE